MARPRPFSVYYSGGMVSHTSTVVNAAVAIVRRLLLREHKWADVYYNEVCVLTIAYSNHNTLVITIRSKIAENAMPAVYNQVPPSVNTSTQHVTH